jgi:NTE family protein
LSDLPADPPRFVINATNLHTGSLFRFSKPYMGDYKVGRVLAPKVELAVAVAASSAFRRCSSPDPQAGSRRLGGARRGSLHRPPFTTEVVLSDGGV